MGGRTFAMLLKHTDIQNASRAANRLGDITSESHFFVGDKEVPIEIAIGISSLDTEKDVETIIAEAMEAQKNAEDSKQIYIVYTESSDDD
jgi:PleD family two-component response regulator